MDIILYEMDKTRSVRCRWTLLELGLEFEAIAARPLLHTDELRAVNPMGKSPAILIDGAPLFESCAICTALADACPDKGLIFPSGTRERALHDQWTCFALSELEAWLWHSARHSFVYPEDQRIPDVIAPNGEEFKKGARVVDDWLETSEYMVANAFSVTDINVSFALNWGRRSGLTADFPAIDAYLDRLYRREHCVMSRPE